MKGMTGKLIMFEGPDGVGKTTQIELAKQALENDGQEVFSVRVHGGTPIGEKLRNVSLSDTPRSARTDLFISMAIHSELQAELHQMRKSRTTVLLDRGSLSMWAYQVFGSRMPGEEAAPYIDQDLADFDPDLIICYEAKLQTLRGRMTLNKAKGDYFEKQDDEYFERVIKGYEYATERYKTVRINAEDSVEQVHTETMRKIEEIL